MRNSAKYQKKIKNKSAFKIVVHLQEEKFNLCI